MVLAMQWDAIIQQYPEDVETIQRARHLRQRVGDLMESIDVPRLAAPLKDLESADVIPVAALADICRTIWRKDVQSAPDVDFEEALAATLSGSEIPAIGPEACDDSLQILLGAVVTAYFRRLREVNEALIPQEHLDGSCPFCLSCARIGLDFETSRILVCSLCSHQWAFPRLRCPFCGNKDHTTLGYFETEDISGARVYYCSECKHYIKVIDTRIREIFDAETGDVLTLFLDDLARQEGFLEP